MIVLYYISALQIRQGTSYPKQWTLLAMLLSYLYQQLGSCQHYRSYPLLLYPYPMLSVFTICCISGPLTVLTNMSCYTSLCTSSTLGTSLSFPLQVYSFSFPSSTLPINKLGLLAWVHTFYLAIACVRLGGSLTHLLLAT